MKRYMLDFESFGNGKNACVIQIGCSDFDVNRTFKCNIDARDCVRNGADMDADTIYWWMSQDVKAIQSVTADPKVNEHEAFNQLNDFLADADEIWSHATYDFVILTETLKRLNIKPKFSFRTARDIRTLMCLAPKAEKGERKGLHHDALDDCYYQIEYCKAALEALRNAK